MINLKEQLHEGCTVHFRCGGSAIVEKYHISVSHLPVSLKFDEEIDNYHKVHYYKNDGKKTAKRCLDDIVKIDPKPFDWKDVKQGMCFVLNTNTISNQHVYYVGEHLDNELRVVVDCRDATSMNSCYDGVPRKNLTRYEEGDLK